MSIDKTIAPYFDTFQASKNYKHVLFAAGRPVQARELNEAQSIVQDQLGKFADHVFKNGSRVSNGTVSIVTLDYVRLKDFDSVGVDTDLSKIPDGIKLKGESSGVTATVVKTSKKTTKDPNTLFVIYTGYGIDGKQNKFLNGENIQVIDDNDLVVYNVTVRCPGCPTSLDAVDEIEPCAHAAKQFVVADGVYYYNGYFVTVSSANIIFSKYGENVTCKIGFDVSERIITADTDVDLYDNALGYPNESSQGADRIVVDFNLILRSKDIADGSMFVELANIEDGYIQTIKSDYEYSNLMDTMAQRTFDESGNYTVKAFPVRVREHKKSDITDQVGFKLDGDESLLQAVIGTGIGYVKGYRKESLFESILNIPKARTTKSIQNGSVYIGERAYIDLIPDETMSVWPNNPAAHSIMPMTEIQLYDSLPQNNAPVGTVVGSLMITDAVYMGKNKNSKDVWRYYVTNVKMNANAAKVKSVSNETARFLAVLANEEFSISNSASQDLFFDTGLKNVKSLRDSNNNTKGSVIVSVRTKLNATLDQSGTYTFTSANSVFDSSIKDTILIVGDASNWVSINATVNNCKPSGNNLLIDLGSSHSGKKLYVIHSLTSIELIEKTKQSATHIVSNIARASTNNFANDIPVGKADCYILEYVNAFKSTSPNIYEDVTAKFELNPNTTYYHYGESSVKLRTGETVSNEFDAIEIKVRYFSHSDSSGSGYFTVDSYKSVIDDVDSGVTYATLPTIISHTGDVYSVAQLLDFRPIVLGGETVNAVIPTSKSTVIFDVDYYVGRKDYIALHKSGDFYNLMGIPSDTPVLPTNVSDDYMALYALNIPAFTYSYKDVKMTRIENKRYTMRDIGRLETRIENLEYYTTLSMLENSAAAATVKDAGGFDRYKNGFVVDDFKTYNSADTASSEFKCTIDKTRGELRPNYSMISKALKFDATNSQSVLVKNGIAMLPYSHKLEDSQPFASRPLSINPYLIYRKAGMLVLTPNVDSWADVDRVPELVVDIDTGLDALQQLAKRQNTIVTSFNDWYFASNTVATNGELNSGLGKISNKTNVDVTSVSTVNTQNFPATQTRRAITTAGTVTREQTTSTTTTTSIDKRTESHASIEGRTTTYNYDAVTDVAIIPYMRATQIEFTASGLMPNTRFYVYFDNKNVSGMTSILGSTDKVSNALSSGILMTNADGVLHGLISIPAGMFFTGTKEVRITNDANNTQNETLETSFATAQFFSGGVNTQKQELTMNVVTAVYNEREVSSSTTNVSSTTDTRNRVLSDTRRTSRVQQRNGGGGRDPIAQSFTLDIDCFLSKLELYFETLEPNRDIIFTIQEMENGYPSSVVLGRKVLNTKNMKASFDATVPTTVEFPVPIRLKAGVEYCFVIGGDSIYTRAWIAKLGENAVNVPNRVIDTQVSLGSSFRSQNASTWNAEQYEDIMYNLYICKFTQNKMKMQFDISGGSEFSPLDKVPFESQQGSNFVRVYTKNDHALITGDKVQLAMYPDFQYHATITNGNLVAGHKVTIANGAANGVIKTVEYITPTTCIVTFALLNGAIPENATFTADPFLRKAGNKDILKAYLDIEVEDYDIKQAAGRFTKVIGSVVTNGIPLAMLNKLHQVKRVDDNRTFIIEVEQQALKSGRFGASGSVATVNNKADLVNIAGTRLLHDSTESWKIQGISHGETNSIFNGDNYVVLGQKELNLCADRYLDRPIKIASLINENERIGGRASVIATANFESGNEYLSPQVNIDTFNMICVSNDVQWTTPDLLNNVPNSSNRFVPETNPAGGSEHFVYVSKIVTLKNPAADMRILFDAYKPIHTDLEIYVKLLKVNQSNIDEIEWVKVTGYDNTATSSNLNNIVEIDLLLGDLLPSHTGLENLYNQFRFKLVGRSKNTANPPLVKNLRVIAYT